MEAERDQGQTRPPNPEEERWFDYVADLPFLSDEYLTKFSDKLLGLNTAMIAAYIAGIKLTSPCLRWYFWIPVVFLLFSLSLSLLSIRPKQASEKSDRLQDVRGQYLCGINRRRKQTNWALLLYALGLFSGLLVILLN